MLTIIKQLPENLFTVTCLQLWVDSSGCWLNNFQQSDRLEHLEAHHPPIHFEKVIVFRVTLTLIAPPSENIFRCLNVQIETIKPSDRGKSPAIFHPRKPPLHRETRINPRVFLFPTVNINARHHRREINNQKTRTTFAIIPR